MIKKKTVTKGKGRTQDENYEILTHRLLDAIEYAVKNNTPTPWQAPNTPAKGGLFPHNAEYLKPYRGINVFMLRMEQSINQYPTAQWLTFHQIRKFGGDVTGIKGTPISYWDFKKYEVKDENGEVESTRIRPILYLHTVWNLAQITGLNLPKIKKQKIVKFDPIAEAEKIIKNFTNKPPIFHDTGNERFFSPPKDEIHLPPQEVFISSDRYYKTVFHELVHSTGHISRLDRWKSNDMKAKHFGDEAYSKEELVAEFGAAFLCMESGINSTEKNSIAYLRGWMAALKHDKKLALQAAGQAQKASDYILGRKAEVSK